MCNRRNATQKYTSSFINTAADMQNSTTQLFCSMVRIKQTGVIPSIMLTVFKVRIFTAIKLA
jgi:hypothetical protein